MNAGNNPLISRERLGSLGLVLAAHVLLAGVLIYAVRMPVRHQPVPELVVSLQTTIKPQAAELPVPLPALKLLSIAPPPLPDLPPLPQVELSNQVAAAPVVAPSAMQAAPAARNTEPVMAVKAVVHPADDAAPTVDASAAGNPKPAYSKISRALGEQGCVLLDVFVQADGTVGDIRLHQSSGFNRLDDSALRTVRQWHFKPARQGGKQVAMWYVQPITFNLQNA